MPEQGVVFNSAPLPPDEYLMRRSHNPGDANVPGAVVRTRRCPECGNLQAHHEHVNSCDKCFVGTLVHSVDVPLLKEDGSSWR